MNVCFPVATVAIYITLHSGRTERNPETQEISAELLLGHRQ